MFKLYRKEFMRNCRILLVCIIICIFPELLYALKADSIRTLQETNSLLQSPYGIHVVDATTTARANAIASKLRSLTNHQVYIIPSGDLFNIEIGGLFSEEDAVTIQRQLVSRGIMGSSIVYTQKSSQFLVSQLPKPDSLNLHVFSITHPITLDGVLDEPEWKLAQPGTGFWQFFPSDRLPATEWTEVRVLQDEDYLYFGITCNDREPDKIVAKDMRRDSGLGDDDYIGLYLDTFHDHRNFYYFSTNPLGTRRDGIVTDANYYNIEWDGIWQCKSVKSNSGWSTEFRIPFSTLRFGGEQPMIWGFNMSRQVRRKQEKFFWAPIPRELGQKGTWKGELFGQLVGIHTSASTRKLELEPFMLGGGHRSYRPLETNSKWNYGGDIRYQFTPNMRGDLSLKTDFAQVEADQEIINFSRFPLFFPEKREFFLDNAGLFTIGFPGDVMWFYSRRIGLSQGTEIPILGAAKLSGRAGNYSLGLLNVQTEETDLPGNGVGKKEPTTNYTVVRVKRDIFSNGSFGTIVTNKEQGADYYNRLVGFDGNIWFNSALKAEGYFSKSFSPKMTGKDICGVGRLLFSKYNVTADLRYYAIGPNYNPELGFVGAKNLRQSLASLGYTQWINSKGIRSVGVSGTYWYDTLYDNQFWVRWARGGMDVTFNSGDNISYNVASETERIHKPFDIKPIHIGRGDYTNNRHTFEISSNASRPLSASVGYTTEDYWTGKRQQTSLTQNFHPIANLSVDLIYAYNTVEHPILNFHTNTLTNRILYAFNTDLFAKTFVQWNDLDKRVSANFLLSYMYRPGSDLYIVYNEIWDRYNSLSMTVRDRILMLKVTHNFRI